MHHQLLRFVLGALFALVALLFAPSIHANSLVNDPFIQQQINKRSFEPGGANHLFGSRGAVSDRKGDIHIIATASIQAGGVNIDQAVIAGYYQYNVKFGGHEHDEHSPFTNSNSQDKTNQQAVTGIDFTSLSLKWTGTEVHPADAPFEWLGASDAADGIALAKDLVTLEAIRALPHNQKLQVVHGIKAVQGIQNQYGQWRAANPNVAAALSAVADVAGASFKKGGNSQSVAGDRITGPRGGGATDTGHVNADGQTIYQRDSGSHYSFQKDGKQQRENSPSEHGNTLNKQPTYVYRKMDENGNFLKNGITINPKSRYKKQDMEGKTLEVIGGNKTLPRDRAVAVERFLTERNPGPENK